MTPVQIGYLTDDIEHQGAADSSSPDNTSPDSDEIAKKRLFNSSIVSVTDVEPGRREFCSG